ncbi:dipeptidyl peptidase [Aspergillus sclerotioniger CBS 115572]|uniref:Dipeptidyl peptidase 3 n=1 Tax=Aspergillus sclerotioniger CBS 115572 TaxID=1450535 RepID=A0A317X677_9EURO|nr:dipeptidyl peptidase [Aspergillus sclerotioniger CBS 115572]PWY93815.1 dipeptidyl peptidase [Aspergillus sclerotioniger CBS 115572]
MDAKVKQHYLADSPPTVVRLEVKSHFDNLKDQKLRKYAHYLSRAAFEGARITLRQVSPESEPIYDLIIELHRACDGNWTDLARKTGVSDENLRFFLEYAAQFLGNCGNYKGFGDSKFIPRLPVEAFQALASLTPKTRAAFALANTSGGGIYETDVQSRMHLGYSEGEHMTTYYPDSPSITKDEITAVSDLMEQKGLPLENTRLRKTESGDFELLIASGVSSPPARDRDLGEAEALELDGKLEGKKLRIVFGDHREEMAKIAHSVKQAGLHAANDNQKRMLDAYAMSFGSGSIEAFKESQRIWVKDQKPALETNLGFVETYRDPHGVRGEWEGFVALVNLERTRAFGKLVDSAEAMIPKLPWGQDFEKDKFLSPDFTSLEVLSFQSSGIPAGINLPNYDDIRQNLGFKNVSLGNVLSAKAPNEPVPFIADKDLEVYRNCRDAAFEVQVGIHELLGHGTGKLLQETAPGEYNFDISNPPISPVTNKPIASWYKPGQTWGSVFGALSSSYEECRAECVAMVLSCDFSILKLFGFGDGKEDLGSDAGDVLFAGYLQMARAGLVALEFWDPKTQKWGQAHMQARYSILRTFLEAGDDFVKLSYGEEDLSDLEIHLDRSKILTHGRPAVEKYLQKLHVYKSTADFEAGKKLYDDITSVDEWWGTKVREIVLKNKIPRKVFVQGNTILNGDEVTLKENPGSGFPPAKALSVEFTKLPTITKDKTAIPQHRHINPDALSWSPNSSGSPATARPYLTDSVAEEDDDDFYTAPPPPHSPYSEASSSLSSSRPPPFSSLVFAPATEFNRGKVTFSPPESASAPTSVPLPPDEEPLEPSPSSSLVAETKASFSRDQKSESPGKSTDEGEPPPPYTEGSSPIESFTYVMAAAGGASSIITQVQQTGGPPINTLGDIGGDEHITLDLRGTRFTLSRDELLTLPEFVLLSLFPNGLLPDGHMGTFHEGDIYPVDYDPASLQYMLDFFRSVAQSIPSSSPSASTSPDLDVAPDSMQGTARDMLQDRAGIIVLREDLDFYAIPPRPDIEHTEMIEVKRAAARALLKQDGIFSGLRKSDEVGSTEQHLIEMLTAGGFDRDDRWGHRAPEPNKAVICSLALAKLRTDIRGDISNNNAVGMAQKLLLFWRKPARRCWWEGIELDDVEGVEGKVKIWIRRVWTLEMSVIGLR